MKLGSTVLICRFLLASVFAVAAAAKLADPNAFTAILAAAGIPAPGMAGACISALELSLCLALVLGWRQRFVHWATLGVLSGFTIFLLIQQLRGATSCGCFGSLPGLSFLNGAAALPRNVILLGACTVLLRSRGETRFSLDHWLSAQEASRA